VAANIILDIQACRPPREQPVTAAVDIVEKIEAKLPR
jgi:serine/threonine-protein kinase